MSRVEDGRIGKADRATHASTEPASSLGHPVSVPLRERLLAKFQAMPAQGTGWVKFDGTGATEIWDDGKRLVNPDGPEAAEIITDLLEALEGLIDDFPQPATDNEYELIQWGLAPEEAKRIVRAVRAIAKARGEA